uniref:BACK domain-containing protein n=1 Tax=Clytia hemisphaerica TaxID=252671 RepID=A0A7M5XGM0_9CNID
MHLGNQICEKFISSSINIENACCSMQAAVTFGLDNFKRTLLPFIEQNTAEIFKTKSFNELSETTLSYILQSDELTMDEYDLMKAIKGWAVVNSIFRYGYAEVLCLVNILKLDTMDGIRSFDHLSFVCDTDKFAFIGMKFH